MTPVVNSMLVDVLLHQCKIHVVFHVIVIVYTEKGEQVVVVTGTVIQI